MREITKYLCGVCSNEYHKPEQALACEKRVISGNTDNVKIGDEITFFMQLEFAPGSESTFKEVTGIVIHKETGINTRTEEHEQIIFCEVGEKGTEDAEERGVIYAPKDGAYTFEGPLEYAFKPGFIEAFKASKI
jgi:hypothetical protein